MTVWLLICVGIIGLSLYTMSAENTRSGLYTYNKVQQQNYNLQMRRNKLFTKWKCNVVRKSVQHFRIGLQCSRNTKNWHTWLIHEVMAYTSTDNLNHSIVFVSQYNFRSNYKRVYKWKHLKTHTNLAMVATNMPENASRCLFGTQTTRPQPLGDSINTPHSPGNQT